MKQTENIIIRCTEKEKKMLKKMAESKDKTITDYIKDKIFGRSALVRITKDGMREV